jgi:hypothetical protein
VQGLMPREWKRCWKRIELGIVSGKRGFFGCCVLAWPLLLLLLTRHLAESQGHQWSLAV